MAEFNVTSILDDSLDIISNVTARINSSKTRITKFYWKKIFGSSCKKKVLKIFNNMIEAESILFKDDIYDLATKLRNTFPASNGNFKRIISADHYTLNQDYPDEYHMNELKVLMKDGLSVANIVVYDKNAENNENIIVDFRIVYDEVFKFTNSINFSNPNLYTESTNVKKYVRELNVIILETMRDYIEYCFDNISTDKEE